MFDSGHINRGRFFIVTNNEHKNRKSGQAKIKSFLLCQTLFMPNNAKQKRGYCHNPIFTPGIFSNIGRQNEATRPS